MSEDNGDASCHANQILSKQDKVQIPLVDVSKWFRPECEDHQCEKELSSDQLQITEHIDQALSEFGFVLVTGHGCSVETFDAVYQEGKKFFNSCNLNKRGYDRLLGYGYGGYLNNSESGGKLTGENNKTSDKIESLTMRGLGLVTKKGVARNGQGAQCNEPYFGQDMSEVPYPDSIPPNLLHPVQRMHDALYPFKVLLTRIAEKALGLKIGELAPLKVLDENNKIGDVSSDESKIPFLPSRGGLRLAYYPELDSELMGKLDIPPDDSGKETPTLGYGAHADSGGAVVLRLDRQNPIGTEVLYKGKWLSVPIPGEVCTGMNTSFPTIPDDMIVLNGGTVLQRLTQGRWKAAIHRVVRRNCSERLSIVYGAMVPGNDVILSSSHQTQNGKNAPIIVKDYLDARVKMQRPECDISDTKLASFIDQMTV